MYYELVQYQDAYLLRLPNKLIYPFRMFYVLGNLCLMLEQPGAMKDIGIALFKKKRRKKVAIVNSSNINDDVQSACH